MSLSSGDHLGPYQILGLIGSGGMGEVYRARDPRLGRDVALKVLRRSSVNADALTRFSREAQATSALNHPHILAVFDVGSENGLPYIVTELLEGETLRARLNRGMLPYRKAVEYGMQIAHALDAAHAKGIWHRDVKPGNVFITETGSVKLLDFGIAKLAEPKTAAPDEATGEDTETGEVMGTAGYMSPEQIRGEPVDHRVDIFALGAVLYEMFTGERAFRRASRMETSTAVLQEDPADPVALNASLPPQAAAMVLRCLEKNREERIQSARDLAFDLQQLRDITGAARPLILERRTRSRRRLVLGVAVVLVGAAVLAVLLIPPRAAPSFEQVTFHRGRISGARFASDGQAVVYSEARQGNDLEVWRLDFADSPASRPLPYPVGSEVLAARAGELALSLQRQFFVGERFVGTLAVAALGGGEPRKIATGIEDADWSAATGEMAVVRLAAGGQSQIEFPFEKVLYRSSGSIRFLRVSPDGRRLAFLEDPVGRGVGGTVSVLDLDGTVTRLTEEWDSARGLAWSAEGDEIWFTAGKERAHRALYAVTLAGRVRPLLQAPGSLTLWDIASDGRALLTRDEERRAIRGIAPGQTVERDLSMFDDTGVAGISRDGRLIVLGDRFGVFVRETDGKPPIQLLKDGFADDLSPDKKTVLATVGNGRTLALVPVDSLDSKPLPPHGITSYRGARWFPDGRRVLFVGMEKNQARSYVQHVDGGAPAPITPANFRALIVSPTGSHVAAIDSALDSAGITIWPVAGGPSTLVKGSLGGDRPVAWSDDGRFLWLFRRNEIPGQIYKLEISTGRRTVYKILLPPDPDGVYSLIDVQVTPSGHAYAYTYTRLLSQLYLVRGLK